jgi:hypothetical protein
MAERSVSGREMYVVGEELAHQPTGEEARGREEVGIT